MWTRVFLTRTQGTISLQDPEVVARKYFDPTITDRERAIFEGGIALGAIYHQFTGMPVSDDASTLDSLERAIEASARLQPHRVSVKSRINRAAVRRDQSAYGYCTLKGEHLDVAVRVKYGTAEASLRMKHLRELNYPLMFIEKITETPKPRK